MKTLRLGGYASLALTLQFILTLVLFAVVLPQYGLKIPTDFNDPAKGLGAIALAPGTFAFLNLINASFAITTILVTIGLRARLGESLPGMRIALLAAAASAALFLAGGVLGIIGFDNIANDVSAYRAINAVASALVLAGTSAAGWILLISGGIGIRTRQLPVVLSYLLILGGAIEILEFLFPIFLTVDPFLGIIWSIWLGFVLLRSKPGQS
jgi:hypothetical protein